MSSRSTMFWRSSESLFFFSGYRFLGTISSAVYSEVSFSSLSSSCHQSVVCVITINSLHAGVIFHQFLSSADIFKSNFFKKFFLGTLLECQTVWVQIRPDITLCLTWVQTICKDYQQTTKVASSRQRVKQNHFSRTAYMYTFVNYDGLLFNAYCLFIR